MKHKILDDNQEIKFIKGVYNTSQPFSNSPFSDTRIRTCIYTDGNPINCGEETIDIDGCKINGKSYDELITTLKEVKLNFEDANFVIKVVFAKEFRHPGSARSFEVIKNIDVYLKNPRDKDILKIVRKTIKGIKSDKTGYSSLIAMSESKTNYQKNNPYIYETEAEGIYKLRTRA